MNLIKRIKIIKRMKRYAKRLDACIPPLSEETKKQILVKFMVYDSRNWSDGEKQKS
jgi:hypothetical protein